MDGPNGFSATSYGDAIADVYDELFTPDGYGIYGASETEDTVDFLEALASGGPALEVGAGTGRVALALAKRGVEVTAVEISDQMVRRLRAKPGGQELPLVQGDFLTAHITGRFRLVYTVFNTLMAFATQESQLAFFTRVGEQMTGDGKLVIENVVSPEGGSPGLIVRRVTADHVLASAFSYDPANQTTVKQHILLRDGAMWLFPLATRHIWPSEMDLMARLAGLRRQSRYGGWHREEYTASSKRHISTYTFHDA
ncbi:MAG TPA: class I SAM-dependent methyltransferase [Candidatus Limnocylindrales bacterium]|nr:class I SAM-dependent methyltransferase [Candidatus Limnocylindrales bacterium]